MKSPAIDDSCFVAAGATVLGDVEIGPRSSVWFGAVVRGDAGGIRIGRRTNIQDLCILHVDGENDLAIGDDVTVGHRAIVHGCKVDDRVLIGMGAIIMNGAEIGSDSIVGAGAVVTEGTRVPPRSLVVGIPARVKRDLTDEEIAAILESAEEYAGAASSYKAEGLGRT